MRVPYSCSRLMGVLPGLDASICSILRIMRRQGWVSQNTWITCALLHDRSPYFLYLFARLLGHLSVPIKESVKMAYRIVKQKQ